MTTLTNQNTAVDPTPALVQSSGGTNSNNSGSITQGGINPSAAAMLILYQVMAMYSKITGINAQEQKTQITAQKNMAKSEANATIAAGRWLGIMMMIGAGAALLTTVIGTGISNSANAKINKSNSQTAELEQNITPAKSIAKLDDSIEDPAAEAGEINPVITRRAAELEQGTFQGGDEAGDKRAVAALRQDPERYQTFRNRLDDRLGTFEKARNSNASNNQTLWQQRQQIGSAVQQVGNAANSGLQAGGQMQQAQKNAEASLSRSSNSMAQQTASSQADAARKAGDAQNAVVNVLNAIRQASSNV